MPEEDLVDVKFRMYDGSDIGPFRYSSASTVAMLKERIVSEWPREKKIAPKVANEVKLINAGKVLENSKTVSECRLPFEVPGGVITMHVVVQPSLSKLKPDSSIAVFSPRTAAALRTSANSSRALLRESSAGWCCGAPSTDDQVAAKQHMAAPPDQARRQQWRVPGRSCSLFRGQRWCSCTGKKIEELPNKITCSCSIL